MEKEQVTPRRAEQNERFQAEMVRRGLEYITTIRPPREAAGQDWKLPPGRDCGPFRLPFEWKGTSAA